MQILISALRHLSTYLLPLLPLLIQAQDDYSFIQYNDVNISSSTQGIVEAPDGTIYAYHGALFASVLYRYDEENNQWEQVTCSGCEDQIADLAIGPDQTIYVAQQSRGILALDTGGVETIVNEWVDNLAVTPDGRIFFLENSGNVSQVADAGVIHYNTANDGLEVSRFYDITADTSGMIWIGSDIGLISFDGSSFELKPGLDRTIYSVIQTNTGDIWVRPGNAKPERWTGSAFESTSDRFPPTLFELNAFDIADGGVLWGSSSSRGIFRDDFTGSEATLIDPAIFGFSESIPFIRYILVDRQNRIWITGDFGYILKIEERESTTGQLDQFVQEHTLDLFPNPAREMLQFTLPAEISLTKDAQLDIFNIENKPVLQKEVSPHAIPYTISLSGWSSGIYHIILRQGNKYWRSRFVRL